jgi:hypothetical protein
MPSIHKHIITFDLGCCGQWHASSAKYSLYVPDVRPTTYMYNANLIDRNSSYNQVPDSQIAITERNLPPRNTELSENTSSRQSRLHRVDKKTKNWAEVFTAVTYATVPAWANVGLIISLIFGGCCGNVGPPNLIFLLVISRSLTFNAQVFTLEAIIKSVDILYPQKLDRY